MINKNKFPIKSLVGAVTYGLVGEYFDFGSKDWFPSLRPDIWLAHPLYGYFLASLGRWGAEKINLLKNKKDLTSKIVGGTGIVLKEILDIIRYTDINAFSVSDMLGGTFGVLLENYLALKKKQIQKDF
jgi:hypothetical protein